MPYVLVRSYLFSLFGVFSSSPSSVASGRQSLHGAGGGEVLSGCCSLGRRDLVRGWQLSGARPRVASSLAAEAFLGAQRGVWSRRWARRCGACRRGRGARSVPIWDLAGCGSGGRVMRVEGGSAPLMRVLGWPPVVCSPARCRGGSDWLFGWWAADMVARSVSWGGLAAVPPYWGLFLGAAVTVGCLIWPVSVGFGSSAPGWR